MQRKIIVSLDEKYTMVESFKICDVEEIKNSLLL
jgi:hypothetical protein